MNDASVLHQDVLTWGLALILGVPTLAIVLNEWIERLQRRNIPLANALPHFRNLVLPLLAASLVMHQVIRLNSSEVSLRTVETFFWISVIYAGLSLINTTLTTRKKPAPLQIRVPNLYLLLARLALIILISMHVLANIWVVNLSQIAAAFGVGSLVIALALQSTLSNLVSGFLLILERPFEEGDWLRIDKVEGEVIDMNWRAVRLRTRNGDVIVIPNGELGKATFENYTLLNPLHAERVYIKLSYNDPPNQVIQVLQNAALETKGIAATPAPKARIREYGDFFIDYEIKLYIKDYPKKDDIRGELFGRIYYAVKRHKLTIPFPIQTETQTESALLQSKVPEDNILEQLEALPYLSFLDPSTLKRLAQESLIEEYGTGEFIVKTGEFDRGLFIVWHGSVQLSVKMLEGEKDFFCLGAGDCFGEMSLLSGQPSLVTVSVIQDSQMIVIPIETVTNLAEHNFKFAMEMNQLIEDRKKAIRLTQVMTIS